MKKFKLLRIGKCYLNREGDMVVALVKAHKNPGFKTQSYQFVGSFVNKFFPVFKFQLLSRIVPNDGSWTEVDTHMFKVVQALHNSGHVVKLPDPNSPSDLPVIAKY